MRVQLPRGETDGHPAEVRWWKATTADVSLFPESNEIAGGSFSHPNVLLRPHTMTVFAFVFRSARRSHPEGTTYLRNWLASKSLK